jgi:hypothetical protein
LLAAIAMLHPKNSMQSDRNFNRQVEQVRSAFAHILAASSMQDDHSGVMGLRPITSLTY